MIGAFTQSRRFIKRCYEHWLQAGLLIDIALAILITLLLNLPLFPGPSASEVEAALIALSAIVATLGGLTTIAIGVYQSMGGIRARRMRSTVGSGLRLVWLRVMRMTVLACGLCIVGILLPAGNAIPYSLLIFSSVLAGCSLVKMIEVFGLVLAVSDRDSRPDRRVAAPPIGAGHAPKG